MSPPDALTGPDAIDVREVVNRRERRLFLRLPWGIYADDPCWVPPLLSALDKHLDPKHHPFFEHGEIRLYLAWRGGRPVGRIAAIVNRLHNQQHSDKTGFWGFFETERDPAVAKALLNRAAQDLAEHGMTEMIGPFNPSINSECGLLVEGFDRPPVILMPYNPPWYPELVEGAGLRPVKELHAYFLRQEQVMLGQESRDRLERILAAVHRRHPEITVRPLDMARYESEVLSLGELFNAARSNNWGYVPVTTAELLLMAREMKPIAVPDLVLIAEIQGRPVGCLLALPDINLVLQKLNGRLLPFGWLRLLWRRRRIRSVRSFGAACLPEYRNLGITPLLFTEVIHRGHRLGYKTAELSWIAEDNLKSMRTIEAALHAQLYKRYRIYGRGL